MIASFFNNLGTRLFLLGGLLIGMWIGVLSLKQQVENLKIRCAEIQSYHHQNHLQHAHLKKQMDQIQGWNEKNQLNIFDLQMAESSFHALCKESHLLLQDLCIKNEEDKSPLENYSHSDYQGDAHQIDGPQIEGPQVERPQFHYTAQISAVLKSNTLENFYTFIELLPKNFPGIVVYKIIKISKITNTNEWVALISFSSFNADLTDYITPLILQQPPIESPLPPQSLSVEENSIPLTFLLEGILYKNPQDWTIWLNDQKINDYFISDQLRILKVLPQEVHFILPNQEIIIVEVGKKLTLSPSASKNGINDL